MIRFEVDFSDALADFIASTITDMPLHIEAMASGAVNYAAQRARAEIQTRIQADTGIGKMTLIASALASNYAKDGLGRTAVTIYPRSTRIPLKYWSTQVQESSRTRATVYVRQGGEWRRVWGFVNPSGPRRYALDRPTDKTPRGGRGHLAVRDGRGWLESAPGSSIKQSFSAALTPSLGAGVQSDLISEFMRRFNAGEIFGKVA